MAVYSSEKCSEVVTGAKSLLNAFTSPPYCAYVKFAYLRLRNILDDDSHADLQTRVHLTIGLLYSPPNFGHALVM